MSAWWWSGAVRAVALAASSGIPFDVSVLARFGVPAPDHPSHWGALVSACATRKMIEATGTATLIARDDGRLVPARQWRGTAEFRAQQLEAGR